MPLISIYIYKTVSFSSAVYYLISDPLSSSFKLSQQEDCLYVFLSHCTVLSEQASLSTQQITMHVDISCCITNHISTTFQILICLRPPHLQKSCYDLPLTHSAILSTYSCYKKEKQKYI